MHKKIYQSKHTHEQTVEMLVNRCTRVQTHQSNLPDKWCVCVCVFMCVHVGV